MGLQMSREELQCIPIFSSYMYAQKLVYPKAKDFCL